MELLLNGKIILVAGNAGIFCNALSAALTIEGAIPVWLDTSKYKNHEAFSKDHGTHNGSAVAIRVNGNEHESGKDAVEKIVRKFGGIDGLVNCPDAGDHANRDPDNQENFHQQLHNHLLDYFLTACHVLPALKKSSGPIINVVVEPRKNETHSILHTAINSGYHALTREWAVELLANGIRVNAVCAPSIEGPTDGLINTILFLLSSRSSHTTGQLIYTGHNN